MRQTIELPKFIDGQEENTFKVAYINTTTSIVENIIIVKTLDDIVPKDYKIVEIPKFELDYIDEELELYNFLQSLDPEFIFPDKKKIEKTINIGITKWSEKEGFYE